MSFTLAGGAESMAANPDFGSDLLRRTRVAITSRLRLAASLWDPMTAEERHYVRSEQQKESMAKDAW